MNTIIRTKRVGQRTDKLFIVGKTQRTRKVNRVKIKISVNVKAYGLHNYCCVVDGGRVRSRAQICCPSIGGVAGSNPAGGKDVGLFCIFCVICSDMSLKRDDQSFNGVLSQVLTKCAYSRNLNIEPT
jgi:hypothetical protein